MPKFRKKPVVIEAEQFQRACLTRADADRLGVFYDAHSQQWMIPTLEGTHIVSDGDWIITGVQGERYPCKNDIFRLTYEPVEDGA
jgi:hypothetical protein